MDRNEFAATKLSVNAIFPGALGDFACPFFN